MPTAPTSIALGPEKAQLILENASRTLNVARVQSLSIDARLNTERDEELGNSDPVGFSQDPIEPRISWDQFDVNIATELILAGKAVDATTVTLTELMSDTDIIVHRLLKNTAGSIFGEEKVSGCMVSDVTWSFPAQGQNTLSWTLLGTDYVTLTSGFQSWGSADTVSPSSIRGRDAVALLGGHANTDTLYRLQNLTIRATRNIQPVRQLGDRSVVGYMSVGVPVVTIDFDVLEADLQPETLLTSSLDYNQTIVRDLYIFIFDPTDVSRADIGSLSSGAEKSFVLENVVLTDVGKRVAVRGLAAKRFSGVVSSVDTAGSGGMTIASGDVA